MAWSPELQRSREVMATPLENVPGVGPKLLEKFSKLSLRTVEDLLYTLPSRYEDRRQFRKIAELREGERALFLAEILAAGEARTSRSRRRLYEVIVGDGSGTLSLKWFHFRAAWMKSRFPVGRKVLVSGDLKRFGGLREIHHPDLELISETDTPESFRQADPLNFGRIVPVYPLTEGLHQKTARKVWRQVVIQFASMAASPLPPEIREQQGLMPLAEALLQAHWPDDERATVNLAELNRGQDRARRSLVFDELFFLELGMALKRKGVVLEKGIPYSVSHRYTKPLAEMLPYRLTAAQRRVLGEIKNDLMKPHPMNRLVQGDVGSGKTIVALMAALIAIENDTQVAVVAPTEILAEQHYLQFHQWFERLGLSVELLLGSTSGAEKKRILSAAADGEVHMLVGTHAVLQHGVIFKRLGLGIVDEQHRFGVEQRQVLRHKGQSPHLLVMTATPIPRSLALTVFGDLALSVIDELPPGRSPIVTRILTEQTRDKGYNKISSEVKNGRQAYIVYPLVEESEKSDLQAATEAAASLQNEVFPDLNLGLLHGKMKATEKEAVMRRFKDGEIHVLVATTVIEVGIDVPNATIMLVEHAERFGLSQLHQLRGRVGRGAGESTCYLVRSSQCSEDGRKRLEVMSSTTDGFKIAEADLELRGPGDFLGTRQSGLPDFRIANILSDARILEVARKEAFALAGREDFPDHPKYTDLLETLRHRWGNRLELAAIG